MRRPSQLSNSIRQPNSDWQRLLDSYLSTLNSPGTRDNYRRAIKGAMRVMGSLESLTADVLTQYRESLVSRLDGPVKQDGIVPGKLSTATVAWRLIALADFLRFARLTGYILFPAGPRGVFGRRRTFGRLKVRIEAGEKKIHE